MALPPHTESMSTPRLRAACKTGVPSGKRPRFPEGEKTTRYSSSADIFLTAFAAATASAAPTTPWCLGSIGIPVIANPLAAFGVVSHDDIGAAHCLHQLGVQWVGNR